MLGSPGESCRRDVAEHLMNPLMNGKIALVVGGARGIGLAISQRMIEEGAVVYVTSRDQERLNEVREGLGPTCRTVCVDAGEPGQLREAAATAGDTEGRIDSLIFSAGLSVPGRLEEVSLEDFNRQMSLNLAAPLFALQAALPYMKPGGTIVLVGSVAGSKGLGGHGLYAASKAGLRNFARTWTNELSSRGIRINVVSPGPTDTGMLDEVPLSVRKTIIDRVPLGRIARPEEIAAATLFLASEESSFVAGTELCVDGGMIQV